MGKVIYSLMVSLDGYIETLDHRLDWAVVDEELHRFLTDQEKDLCAHLYGRRAYETMAEYWPAADQDPATSDYIAEYARIWKEMPKFVFSTTLDEVEWNSTLVRGNIPEEVAKLKSQVDKDMDVRGAGLAATFMRLGLIDECRLFIQPVLLGNGTPMFPIMNNEKHLALLDDQKFSSGVVYLSYQQVERNGAS